jgi:hypothetical protein
MLQAGCLLALSIEGDFHPSCGPSREFRVMTDGDLERLVALIRVKNDADLAIAGLIGRACAPGNIGEFVAARVFIIELMNSGVASRLRRRVPRRAAGRQDGQHQDLQPPRIHPGHQPLPMRLLPGADRAGRAGAGAAVGHRLRVPVRPGSTCWPGCTSVASRSGLPPTWGRLTGKPPASGVTARARMSRSTVLPGDRARHQELQGQHEAAGGFHQAR